MSSAGSIAMLGDDISFKCDLEDCKNQYSDQFIVNCFVCERYLHTGCADLPNKDYKTIRCKPCYDYMKGIGPEVPKKEPCSDEVLEEMIRRYRKMFEEEVRSNSIYNYILLKDSQDGSSSVATDSSYMSDASEISLSSGTADLSYKTYLSRSTQTTSWCSSSLVNVSTSSSDSNPSSNSTSSFDLLLEPENVLDEIS